MENPKIRAVEAFPVEQQDQTLICLRDPSGLAPEPIMLGMGAYFIVTLFDGLMALKDIQAAFAKRFGEMIPLEKLDELIAALDRAYFLDSPAFHERERRVREEFLASPDRPAALAGLCYEKDPAKLRLELAAFFDPPEGPGRAVSKKKSASLAGLIAPHIDPRRGASAYAHAYHELMAHEPPELVVILGTSHYGAGPELFSATRKNYATPFGAVETDGAFIDRLAARYAGGSVRRRDAASQRALDRIPGAVPRLRARDARLPDRADPRQLIPRIGGERSHSSARFAGRIVHRGAESRARR